MAPHFLLHRQKNCHGKFHYSTQYASDAQTPASLGFSAVRLIEERRTVTQVCCTGNSIVRWTSWSVCNDSAEERRCRLPSTFREFGLDFAYRFPAHRKNFRRTIQTQNKEAFADESSDPVNQDVIFSARRSRSICARRGRFVIPSTVRS